MDTRQRTPRQIRCSTAWVDLLLMLRLRHVLDVLGQQGAPLPLLRLLPVAAEAGRLLHIAISIRAIWAVQDKLALDTDEEKAIELKRELVNGQERTVWNPTLSIPVREFEFTESETARIRTAIENWDGYGAATDRRWLEPLIEALFPAAPSR